MVLFYALRVRSRISLEFDAVGSRRDHLLAMRDIWLRHRGAMGVAMRLVLRRLMRLRLLEEGRFLGDISRVQGGGVGRGDGKLRLPLIADGIIAHGSIEGRRLSGDGFGVHANELFMSGRSRGGRDGDRMGDRALRMMIGGGLPFKVGEMHSKLEEIGEFIVTGGRDVRPGQRMIWFH